jgi:hypothetical protein
VSCESSFHVAVYKALNCAGRAGLIRGWVRSVFHRCRVVQARREGPPVFDELLTLTYSMRCARLFDGEKREVRRDAELLEVEESHP